MEFYAFVATHPNFEHTFPFTAKRVKLPVEDIDKELLNYDTLVIGYESPFEISSKEDLRKLNTLAKLLEEKTLEEMYQDIEYKWALPMFDNNKSLKSLNTKDFNNISEEHKFDIIRQYCGEHNLVRFDNNKNIK